MTLDPPDFRVLGYPPQGAVKPQAPKSRDDEFFSHLSSTETYREDHPSESGPVEHARRHRRRSSATHHKSRYLRLANIIDARASLGARLGLVTSLSAIVLIVLLALLYLAYKA